MVYKHPLISVLIPVYNAQHFLGACLDSVCNQTYRRLEIICLDDGSTDGSAALLAQYARQDERIQVIEQSQGGLASARARLLQRMTGEYFAFVDADDTLTPDFIAKLAKTAQDRRADIVRCLYYLQDVSTGALTPCEKRYKGFLRPAPGLSYKARLQAALDDTQVWLKLVKSSLVTTNRLSFLEGALAEDISFEILLYLYAQKIVFLNEHLYFYRVGNGQSASSNKSAWARGTLENMIYLCGELEKRRFTQSVIYNRMCELTLHAVRRLRKFPALPGDGDLCRQAILTVKEKSRHCSFWWKWKYWLFCALALRLPAAQLPWAAVLIR